MLKTEDSLTWSSVFRFFLKTTSTGAKWRRINWSCTFYLNRGIVCIWTRYIRFHFIFESLIKYKFLLYTEILWRYHFRELYLGSLTKWRWFCDTRRITLAINSEEFFKIALYIICVRRWKILYLKIYSECHQLAINSMKHSNIFCDDLKLLRSFFFCTMCRGNVIGDKSFFSLLLFSHRKFERLFSWFHVRNLQDLESKRIGPLFSLSFCSKSYLCRVTSSYLFPKNSASHFEIFSIS